MRLIVCLVVVCSTVCSQKPPDQKVLKKLLARYLVEKSETEILAIENTLRALPPLTRKEAASWTKTIVKLLRSGKPKLTKKGTGYFYDKKEKRGKYIVSGGGNKKGLILGLHGGGVGSANCTGAASAWSGAISSLGMIGIYPQAIEATEAAWGDDVTVTFLDDLLAAASRTFKFDRNKVYVVGHSMGGYGAWTWGGRFADRWAGTISVAGGPTCIGGPDNPEKVQSGVVANRFNGPMWIYHSDDDPNVPIPPTRLAIADLRAMQKEHPGGYLFKYEEVTKRGHAFPSKGPRPALKWITKFKRDPRPRKIVWEAYYTRPQHSYWLDSRRARGNNHKDGADRVIATWDGKATFRLIVDQGRGEGLGVLLDDAMTDLDAKVEVLRDEEKIFEGIPKRSLLVLARSARSRHDPEMLFSARVPE